MWGDSKGLKERVRLQVQLFVDCKVGSFVSEKWLEMPGECVLCN